MNGEWGSAFIKSQCFKMFLNKKRPGSVVLHILYANRASEFNKTTHKSSEFT